MNERGARLAVGLVAGKRSLDVLAAGRLEAAGEHGGVLNRRRRTLRHVGRHGMTGIAQKHDAALAPARQRLALEDGPLVAVRTGLQHGAHIGVEAGIGLAQLSHIALGRPGFARQPFGGLRHAGDEVELAARRVRVVDDDVAVDAPPFGAGGPDIPAMHQGRRKDRAIGYAAPVQGRVGADDDVAHRGVDTVGADHGIGVRAAGIGERQGDLAAGLIEADQLLAEINDLGRQRREQRFVQIGPMHAQIGRPVEAFRHGELAGDLAGVPDAVEVGARREGDAAQPRLDADLAQHLHRVRHHLDAGADAGKARGLLVDAHIHAETAQRRGDGEAAHAGTDNGNRELPCAHGT